MPTHDDGTCLFWEFATDSYDIGFGVYFEWTKSETNQVSVHIQDSDDEEDDILDLDEEFDDEGNINKHNWVVGWFCSHYLLILRRNHLYHPVANLSS